MNRPLLFLALVLCTSLFLVACDRGQYDTAVDKESTKYFDTQSVNSVDKQGVGASVPPKQSTPVVLNETHEEFVQPPTNASAASEPRFVGKDAVRFYVWNKKGSTHVLLAEGESASSGPLGLVIEATSIGSARDGARVQFTLNSKELPIAREREEIRSGENYIFVSEILLNEAGE